MTNIFPLKENLEQKRVTAFNELKKLKKELSVFSIAQRCTFFLDPSILALVNFRLAAFFYNLPIKIFFYLYWPIWRLISNSIGIEIHGWTKIWEWLRIMHYGGIFINSGSIIGNDCLIYNDVVIGSKDYIWGKSPIIWNNVRIGTWSKILGDISIWNNVNIGALSLVINSYPSGECTIAWNPAKPLLKNK